MSNEDLHIAIGAIFHGKLIASGDLPLNPLGSKSKHVGTWGIAIHPEFQGQRLGLKILRKIEEFARDKGIKKLQAAYISENKSAEALYVGKLKYDIEGRQRFSALLKNGKYADIVLIGKILDKDLLKKDYEC
ncbi:MAG: GNAT family N-acetyltransferase [Candidatus Lokiarchaeota archaeon]|nr:GNAT family N-acetyltransferase [Candidatus Lokiarchaeota archaeon]